MPSTLQSKALFRNPSFSLPFTSPVVPLSKIFHAFSPANPTVFPFPKNIFTFLLTSFSVSTSLSAVKSTLRQKFLSLAFQALAYAVVSYAFFLVFFRSQF
jgi:hypothetical protein